MTHHIIMSYAPRLKRQQFHTFAVTIILRTNCQHTTKLAIAIYVLLSLTILLNAILIRSSGVLSELCCPGGNWGWNTCPKRRYVLRTVP